SNTPFTSFACTVTRWLPSAVDSGTFTFPPPFTVVCNAPSRYTCVNLMDALLCAAAVTVNGDATVLPDAGVQMFTPVVAALQVAGAGDGGGGGGGPLLVNGTLVTVFVFSVTAAVALAVV